MVIGGTTIDRPSFIGKTEEGKIYLLAYTEMSSAYPAGHSDSIDITSIRLNGDGSFDTDFYNGGMCFIGSNDLTDPHTDYNGGGYLDNSGNFYISGSMHASRLDNYDTDPSDIGINYQWDGLIARYNP
ncbi:MULTISPECIES: hypothetical protein [unclassified Oceanispirochaeta]|uniref:hypothetical protein n=1 Tax=unclassified Oceanispirochaeta TaxID=2635722 RepID=UPI000E09D755|nr:MULTISPECIES: hypothetical protein [unclassified Oceanispirochaeta]MBF9018276.1 hypothetical protein [Oceanispirochaeta sp. M2]NPD74741.1 hypothetical protein [Oceanispirochaeta sp. M1]RDG29411.1 hypothetical protein DV872_21800 [Oceanispirochaeta sp. M1]